MTVKSFVGAAILAALAGWANVASAQMNPYGFAYPDDGSSLQPASAIEALAPSCTAPSCSTACPSNCCAPCGDYCCQGYCHRINVFADFLYLRTRGAEVAYAVPVDGEITSSNDLINQVGPVNTVDQDFQPGFRAGIGYVLDECSMIQATYSQLDSNSTDSIQLDGGLTPVLFPLTQPFPRNAAATDLDAQADQTIQFKLIDVDYKGLFAYCCDYKAAYVVGVRYGELTQDFNALYTVNGGQGVFATTNFYGAGLRLGLEGERYGRNPQWFAYGRGMLNLIGGEFRSSYMYGDQGDDAIVNTSWKAGRLVTMTDLEVGLGWQNKCGNIRLSAGYMYSLWFNVVTNKEWIGAVQNNNYVGTSGDLGGFVSFDGLTTRVEYLW